MGSPLACCGASLRLLWAPPSPAVGPSFACCGPPPRLPWGPPSPAVGPPLACRGAPLRLLWGPPSPAVGTPLICSAFTLGLLWAQLNTELRTALKLPWGCPSLSQVSLKLHEPPSSFLEAFPKPPRGFTGSPHSQLQSGSLLEKEIRLTFYFKLLLISLGSPHSQLQSGSLFEKETR